VIFASLWEAVQAIFDHANLLLDECPVCLTPFPETASGSREAIALHVQTELASLQSYRDARDAVQHARQELERRFQELRARMSALESVLKDTGSENALHVMETHGALLATWGLSQKTPDSRGITTLLSGPARQYEQAIAQKEKEQGEHTWAKALTKIDELIEFKSRFEHLRRCKEELQYLHDNLLNQEAFVVGKMRDYGQTIIDGLKTRTNDIFRAVHQAEEAPEIRLELNPDARRPELTLLLDFAPNRQGVPPSGYLSDSQIHTLALSLRLAAIQMFNSRVPLLVVDDVVTSYDADHRRAIAGMLADKFSDHQIIIVTHDDRFFAYLQEQLPQGKWIYKRITELDPDFGPRFHDHVVPDELIARRHDAEQSAANEMRQAEEEWLTQICRDFGVDVRIRDVHHPYEYSRAELAEALARFLRSRKMTPPKVAGVANRFLDTLQAGQVENFGSHFQDNPYGFGSIGDERTRWREFTAFRDAFRCPRCGRKRFKRPLGMDRPVCRNGGCEASFALE
jgi:hypothetical protein